MKTREIKILDVVALLKAIENEGTVLGQVGTVVESLAPGIFEVEFSNKKGETIAMVPVSEKDLILLHFEPVTA
jgi:ribosomal 30S subunit maturation factor RimM